MKTFYPICPELWNPHGPISSSDGMFQVGGRDCATPIGHHLSPADPGAADRAALVLTSLKEAFPTLASTFQWASAMDMGIRRGPTAGLLLKNFLSSDVFLDHQGSFTSLSLTKFLLSCSSSRSAYFVLASLELLDWTVTCYRIIYPPNIYCHDTRRRTYTMAESTSTSAANPASKPELIQSIDLGPKLSLLLGEKDLGILDKSAKKSSRTSCAGLVSSSSEDTRRSIPLYNILWASLTPDSQTVTIDFAEETSSHRLRASKLSFPVPPIAATEPIQTFLSALVSRSYGPARQRKRAYVLANPRAGPGGADRVFDRDVRPLLEAARMDLTVATTGYAGHAGELARTMDLDAYDVVVACSGDGLPYEIFNGFAKRADARSALGRMPVVMVPCGSGNAMACNLYGTHRAAQAGLAIVKGVSTPLDLVSVTQGGTRTLSFLSQALGLIADLDITTEGMRWMGSERFTVGFLWLVFKKKLYPCDIAVKVEIEGKDAVREHYRRRVLEGGSGGGGGAGEGGVVAAPKSDRESEATTPGTDDGPGLPPLRYGTVTDKLPDGWEMIPHEKLWSFYCGNVSLLRSCSPASFPWPGAGIRTNC